MIKLMLAWLAKMFNKATPNRAERRRVAAQKRKGTYFGERNG